MLSEGSSRRKGVDVRLKVVLAAAVSLAVLPVPGANAGTPNGDLYENRFSSKALYREIRQVGGGEACQSRYLPNKNMMRVRVEGAAHCQYRAPVVQDTEFPFQRWTVAGQISDEIARGKRYRAYLTSRVRAGLGGFYELRIWPKTEGWLHRRKAPGENATELEGDRLDAVRPVGAFNRLFLSVTEGTTFRAEINDAGTYFPFEDPEPVDGRGVRFGIGSTLDRPDPVIGYFKLLRAAQPD